MEPESFSIPDVLVEPDSFSIRVVHTLKGDHMMRYDTTISNKEAQHANVASISVTEKSHTRGSTGGADRSGSCTGVSTITYV